MISDKLRDCMIAAREAPPHRDWLMDFVKDAALVAEARIELSRLGGTRGGVPLADCCHVTKVQRDLLAKMLTTFDNWEPPA